MREIHRALEPKAWQKVVMSVVALAALAAVVAFVMLPISDDIRRAHPWLGPLRAFLIILGAWLFFTKFLPPPMAAGEPQRKRFLGLLRRSFAAGVASAHVIASAVASDRDTLVLTMSDEWAKQPADKRLRDAQHLWRLWAVAYSPYDGWNKCLIRLVDAQGRELGASQAGKGSLIYVA